MSASHQVALFYCRRRDALLLAAEKHLKGLASWTSPSAGIIMDSDRRTDRWLMLYIDSFPIIRTFSLSHMVAHWQACSFGSSFSASRTRCRSSRAKRSRRRCSSSPDRYCRTTCICQLIPILSQKETEIPKIDSSHVSCSSNPLLSLPYDIRFRPSLQSCSPSSAVSNCVRAAFSTASDEQMDEAMRRLATLLRNEQQPRK